MATYQSDIIRAKEALDISSKSLSGEKTGAQVLYATAEYVFKPTVSSPTEATGDVIELAEIPAGATVVPQLSYAAKSFTFRNVTLELGDKEDPTRYGSASTLIVAGPSAFGYYDPSHASFGYGSSATPAPYAKATRVQATLQSIYESIPAGSKLTFGIAYRVQG